MSCRRCRGKRRWEIHPSLSCATSLPPPSLCSITVIRRPSLAFTTSQFSIKNLWVRIVGNDLFLTPSPATTTLFTVSQTFSYLR
ncbi:hypothetical protein ACLOJK_023698 [Asimina triloba]